MVIIDYIKNSSTILSQYSMGIQQFFFLISSVTPLDISHITVQKIQKFTIRIAEGIFKQIYFRRNSQRNCDFQKKQTAEGIWNCQINSQNNSYRNCHRKKTEEKPEKLPEKFQMELPTEFSQKLLNKFLKKNRKNIPMNY